LCIFAAVGLNVENAPHFTQALYYTIALRLAIERIQA